MSSFKKATLAAVASFLTSVTAHGHVDWIIVDGVAFRGYDSPRFKYEPNHPPVAGWTIDAPDNGFVEPKDFGTSEIICHKSGKPGAAHITVKAGSKVTLQWNDWPESHKGPVIDYLAKCSGNCESVDKTSLRFFKIGEGGYINNSRQNGFWADDVLMDNNLQWTVQIPASLAPGNYVLRHEMIALHASGQQNGAQAYPQCVNLQVEGSGNLSPAGVAGTSLYKATDPGVLFDLYRQPINYLIPGPALVAGLPSTVAQAVVKPTATSSATVPGGGNGGNGPEPATSLVTSTRAPVVTQAPPTNGGGTVKKYGQCGGQGWTGPTACEAGSTCQATNQYYSQCL